jgi:CBS domain-containing protein
MAIELYLILTFNNQRRRVFMVNHYNTLPYSRLTRDTLLHHPEYSLPLKVTLEDSAISIMTDLCKTVPVTLTPESPLDTASEKMITYGVRLLFVTAESDKLIGLITLEDILSEKPLQVTRETGISFHELIVSDIMTPREKLEAIYLTDMQKACVGEVVATMRMFGRQHALVIEQGTADQPDIIRGIISTTQISKQLGIDITPNNRASTFAELEEALTSVA